MLGVIAQTDHQARHQRRFRGDHEALQAKVQADEPGNKL
jgi:hypothetical protein